MSDEISRSNREKRHRLGQRVLEELQKLEPGELGAFFETVNELAQEKRPLLPYESIHWMICDRVVKLTDPDGR